MQTSKSYNVCTLLNRIKKITELNNNNEKLPNLIAIELQAVPTSVLCHIFQKIPETKAVLIPLMCDALTNVDILENLSDAYDSVKEVFELTWADDDGYETSDLGQRVKQLKLSKQHPTPTKAPTKTCAHWKFMEDGHAEIHKKCLFLNKCDENGMPIGWFVLKNGWVSAKKSTIKNTDGDIVHTGPLIRHRLTNGTWRHQAWNFDKTWIDGTFDECRQVAYTTRKFMET